MIPQERMASSRLENYYAVLVIVLSTKCMIQSLFWNLEVLETLKEWNINFSLNDFMLLKSSFPNTLLTF